MVLFVLLAAFVGTNNLNEDGYNVYNSSLGVQCNSKKKCDYRFSTSCTSCVHNCGMKKDKNSYKLKK